MFEVNGHLICVDCNLKIQKAFEISDHALKERYNMLVDQAEARTGLYGVVPRYRMPVPVIHEGPMNLHTINVDRSVVGAINTGNVKKMEVALNNIHINNQNSELEQKLKDFAEAVLREESLPVETSTCSVSSALRRI